MTLSSVSPESQSEAVAWPAEGACHLNQTERRELPPKPVAWLGSPVSFVARMLLLVTVSAGLDSTSAWAKASLPGALGAGMRSSSYGPLIAPSSASQSATTIRYVVPATGVKVTSDGPKRTPQPSSLCACGTGVRALTALPV